VLVLCLYGVLRRMGSEGKAPPFLTSGLDGGEWSASRLSRITAGKGSPVSIGEEAEWTQLRSGHCGLEKINSIAPGRAVCSQSLYRLSYPGSNTGS
jgi:hypothetical protein